MCFKFINSYFNSIISFIVISSHKNSESTLEQFTYEYYMHYLTSNNLNQTPKVRLSVYESLHSFHFRFNEEFLDQ